MASDILATHSFDRVIAPSVAHAAGISGVLRLRKGADRRLRAGHLWIFSNEVDTAATPLSGMSPGAAVVVVDARGKALGAATVNPASLICGRLYSRDSTQILSAELIATRLRVALDLRERLYSQPCYRLAYGDADGLPGLVVDRFGDHLAVQLTTAGMDVRRELVIEALCAATGAKGILLRNTGSFRQQEQLPEAVELAHGEVPDQIELAENGARFIVSLRDGQKTGWFYDHRDNRAFLQRLVQGKSVLDVFSYVGGWGIEAATAGATAVTCVDSSADALELATANADRNGVGARVSVLAGRAVEVMKQLIAEGRHYDVVVLDPPAFIKRRRDQIEGEKAYHQINQLAVRLLAPGGLLVSASCSLHLSAEQLTAIVRSAAEHRQRQLQIIASLGQGPDHPVHPAIPETAYLKAVFARDICT